MSRRDPLWWMLLGGGLIFATGWVFESRNGSTVELSTVVRDALVSDREATIGRPLTAREIRRLEQSWLTDELLFREAIAAGIHLSNDEVRREIIDLMRFRVSGSLPQPTPEELVAHYADHLDQYRSEESLWFEQVFFKDQPAAGSAQLAALLAGEALVGDDFPQGQRFPGYSRSILNRLFDPTFVNALWDLPLNQWSGPLNSSRGWHFVRISQRLGSRQLPFAAVESQVEGDYLARYIEAATDRFLTEQRGRYRIRRPSDGR